MSAARIEKLKGLLTRVQERRAQPRLSAVTKIPEPPSFTEALTAESSDMETSPPPAPRDGVALLEPSNSPAPVRDATPATQVARSGMAPPSPAAPGSEPPTGLRTQPPPSELRTQPPPGELRTQPPPAGSSPTLAPPADSVSPPAGASEAAPVEERGAAEEPRITAPTTRLEPAPLLTSKAVVRAVSAPVVAAPKSFGELLEASLALRPR